MKGILFNQQYGMFWAAITRKKTQTRRAGAELYVINQDPDQWKFKHWGETKTGVFAIFEHKINKLYGQMATPRYLPGEIVYLKEPVLPLLDKSGQSLIHPSRRPIFYKYPDEWGFIAHTAPRNAHFVQKALQCGNKWSNKLFMAARDARFFVKITQIKIQQVHNITEPDVLAEGIEKEHVMSVATTLSLSMRRVSEQRATGKFKYFYTKDNVKMFFDTPLKAYFSLYDAVGKKNSAVKNPWVFVYDFELCARPASLAIPGVKSKKSNTHKPTQHT